MSKKSRGLDFHKNNKYCGGDDSLYFGRTKDEIGDALSTKNTVEKELLFEEQSQQQRDEVDSVVPESKVLGYEKNRKSREFWLSHYLSGTYDRDVLELSYPPYTFKKPEKGEIVMVTSKQRGGDWKVRADFYEVGSKKCPFLGEKEKIVLE